MYSAIVEALPEGACEANHLRSDSLLPLVKFQFPGQQEGIPNWYCSKNAEGAVNQAPAEWDLADAPADEGARNYQEAGDQPCFDGPNVSDRILPSADKEDREDQVREG